MRERRVRTATLVRMSATTRHILAAPAWPYANGPRHIGHVSGFALPCDMFSRYQRMAGNRVLMVSGTDEHGTPIQVQAEQEGSTARELADRYNQVIGEDLVGLDMSYDLFTRTTTGNHYAVTQEIFTGLYENGWEVLTPGDRRSRRRQSCFPHVERSGQHLLRRPLFAGTRCGRRGARHRCGV